MALAKVIATAAAAAFAYNQDLNELFVTEDGNAFETEKVAINHARGNKLPEPVRVERDQVKAELEALMPKVEKKAVDDKAKAAKAKADEEAAAKAKAVPRTRRAPHAEVRQWVFGIACGRPGRPGGRV